MLYNGSQERWTSKPELTKNDAKMIINEQLPSRMAQQLKQKQELFQKTLAQVL